MMLGAVDRAAVDARLVLCHSCSVTACCPAQLGVLKHCCPKAPGKRALRSCPDSPRHWYVFRSRKAGVRVWNRAARTDANALDLASQYRLASTLANVPSPQPSERSEWGRSVDCRSLCAGAVEVTVLCCKVIMQRIR